MRLLMAGINYKNNCIAIRERLYFTPEKAGEICEKIFKSHNCIYGCVILSTCNRTEIYISSDDNISMDADEILLKYSEITDNNIQFEKCEDNEAVHYIMELACGLKSQIPGDGQIAGQINAALQISRERGCADSVLNTLFRIAVSAGKYSLTNNKITSVPLSSAYGAAEFLSKKYGALKGKKCMVIGNGKMGQLMQKLLLEKGVSVWVTLRSYKRGNNRVIKGCNTISYKDRYKTVSKCDFVISATKSPHFTLTYDMLSQLNKLPDIIIDLAVPRDIEEKVSELCDCYNIDALGYKAEIDEVKLMRAYEITNKFADDFISWKNYRMSLPEIAAIKDIIARRIIKAEDCGGSEALVQDTVKKTVDIMLGSMKDNILPYTMEICRKKIEERARL